MERWTGLLGLNISQRHNLDQRVQEKSREVRLCWLGLMQRRGLVNIKTRTNTELQNKRIKVKPKKTMMWPWLAGGWCK